MKMFIKFLTLGALLAGSAPFDGLGRTDTAAGAAALVHAIARDHLVQRVRLLDDGLAGRGGLLHQRGVLLRRLVHLHDRLVDLFDAGGLLAAGRGNLGNDIGYFLDRGLDLLECLARFIDQASAFLYPRDAVANQRLDFLGRRRAAPCQIANLGGHYGKTAALLTGARRFDRGVQRKKIGLEGDLVDDADDVGDLLRGRIDTGHRGDRGG